MTLSSLRIAIVFVVLCQPAIASARDGGDASLARTMIGTTMPPYPAGIDEMQGTCIPGGPDVTQVCDHAIAVLGRVPADASGSGRPSIGRWIVASRNVDRTAANPRWHVVDATDAPKPRAGYGLQIGTCRIDGAEAPDVIAFVRHRDDEISRDVRWARRYDLAAGRLVPVEAGRVDCINEAAGL